MKILHTGFTTKHTPRREKLTSAYHAMTTFTEAVMWGAEEMGHTNVIDLPGPHIYTPDYDLIICQMIYPNAGAPYASAAFTLISEALARNTPTLVLLDDAYLERIRRGVHEFADIEHLIRKSGASRTVNNWVMENAVTTTEMITRWEDGYWPNVMACAFPWGNHQLIYDDWGAYIDFLLDPTPMCPMYIDTPPDPTLKQRRWVHAGIKPYNKWISDQNLQWPMTTFGAKGLGYSGDVIREGELVQEYAVSWGMFSPPQRHTVLGSGWWRSRLEWAAQAETPIVCAGDEHRDLGPQFLVTGREVEMMKDSELFELAAAQRRAYRAKHWTRQQFRNHLDEVLKEASS